ncbi:hypothetical protein DFH28DRAFT_1123040 [Melampsora americana]|nr:hypothetical protein DFH28DRAFT_1123040 [Melampsora americana]
MHSFLEIASRGGGEPIYKRLRVRRRTHCLSNSHSSTLDLIATFSKPHGAAAYLLTSYVVVSGTLLTPTEHIIDSLEIPSHSLGPLGFLAIDPFAIFRLD